MSFFPTVTSHRYSVASTEDEEEFSLLNICETSEGASPGSFQLVSRYVRMYVHVLLMVILFGNILHPAQMEQSVQAGDGCMLLEFLHCGVQTDEVETLSVPIQLAQERAGQKDNAAQTEETMHSLRENAEAYFRYQLEEMAQKYESMKQLVCIPISVEGTYRCMYVCMHVQ